MDVLALVCFDVALSQFYGLPWKNIYKIPDFFEQKEEWRESFKSLEWRMRTVRSRAAAVYLHVRDS